ncbi:MAG: hypothetical protein KatS3mg126_2146 [Lysobacteraceae bacterium]|nr:MAG: hypothetical protein KatS3mg126_2146 [Xanthomonadaceae bacterium]
MVFGSLLLVLLILVLSLRAVLSDLDPARLRAAGWGALAGGLIVAGLWMILA